MAGSEKGAPLNNEEVSDSYNASVFEQRTGKRLTAIFEREAPLTG